MPIGEIFLRVHMGMEWKRSLNHSLYTLCNLHYDSKGQEPLRTLGFIQKILVYTHTLTSTHKHTYFLKAQKELNTSLCNLISFTWQYILDIF